MQEIKYNTFEFYEFKILDPMKSKTFHRLSTAKR